MSFSFKFSKTFKPKKLADSKLRDDSTKDTRDEIDYVEAVEGNEIKGSIKKEEKKEFVIPMINKNRWRLPVENQQNGAGATNGQLPSNTGTGQSSEDDLEAQAVKEILQSTEADSQESSDSVVIPLLLQNRVPDGFEEEDKVDVSLRAEESTLEDYERCPIEMFGLGMLRGMGWKESDGIGLTNKKKIDMKEPTLRPKGLGLGAERPQANTDAQPQHLGRKESENLVMKIGAFVLINRGNYKGKYGKVESFDEDNNRLMVKLAINHEMIVVSKFYTSLVNERDYKKSSKVINNEKYEEYKRRDEETKSKREKHGKDKKRKKYSRSRSRSRSHSRDRAHRHRDRDDYDSDEPERREKHKKKHKERRRSPEDKGSRRRR